MSVQKVVEAVARCYPFYRGRGRLALSKMFRKNDDTLARRRLKTGQIIYVFPNDYIGRMVSFFGDLDPTVTGLILENVAEGDMVLDIGANLGVITLPVAAKVGSAGKVVSFEPNVYVANALEASVAANGLSNVDVIQKGLSDFCGEAYLTTPKDCAGLATITNGEGEACEVMRLDELVTGGVRAVRLMKIDVEGHEANVLRGGLEFIDRNRVELIVLESHSNRGRFWQREEVSLLVEHDYNLLEIRRGPFLKAQLLPIDRDDEDYAPRSHDFLAVRHDADFVR